MADEASFISLIVAQARVDQLMKYALDSAYPGRQLQSLHDLTELVKSEETVQEAARDSHMARTLTTLLASTTDSGLLDAISALLAALSGSGVHTSRLIDNLAHVVAGASVLELGSGVGSTGVVVAKLGAREVTVTDLTEPLLANLLVTVRANFTEETEYNRSTVKLPGGVRGDAQAIEDLSFSDVDTVSDEEELFCCDDALEDESKPHSEQNGVQALQQTGQPCEGWDVGNIRVRVLDWKLESDRYSTLQSQLSPEHKISASGVSPGMEEDETTSALDNLQIDEDPSTAGRCAQKNSGAANGACMDDRDTFDRPSVTTCESSMPPALDPICVFDVVLGCEVLYETPHAQWVAAAIKLRLKQQGRAWIAGAVRDNKVYNAFHKHLTAMGLQHEWEPIHPAPGYSGLGNKEATYEGGYRLYSIKHS